MRAVNQEATKVLEQLRDRMNGGDHVKLDHGGESIMPVVVERIGRITVGPVQGELISVAHYGEQNGDAMRDPDVVFVRTADGRYFPDSYRNDYMGIHNLAFTYGDAGEVKGVRPRLQRDIAVFCGGWLRNIKQQQGL